MVSFHDNLRYQTELFLPIHFFVHNFIPYSGKSDDSLIHSSKKGMTKRLDTAGRQGPFNIYGKQQNANARLPRPFTSYRDHDPWECT